MSQARSPLSSLSASPRRSTQKVVLDTTDMVPVQGMNSFVTYLLWFIIFAVIAWFILYSLKPSFVLKGDGSGDIDTAKVLFWAVVIGLIGIFICWLLKRSGY